MAQRDHKNGKNTFCVFKEKPTVPQVYVCKVPSFDFGKALGEKYPLLRLIFNYLCYDDLLSCTQVNDLWNLYAAETLIVRKVRTPGFFFLTKLKKRDLQLECNAYHDMAFGFIFCKLHSLQNISICLHKGEDFKKLDAFDVVSKHFIGENIPFMLGFGIRIGIYNSLAQPVLYPVRMAGFLIPKIANVIIERFYGMEEQFIARMEEKIFQNNLEIRAVFVFGTSHRSRQFHFVHQILRRQKKLFVLCGGIISQCKCDLTALDEIPKRYNKAEHFLVISVPLESTNFEAYSALYRLEEDDIYEDFLKRVQRKIIFKKYSVALGCLGDSMIEDERWLERFAEYFPNIPITCVMPKDVYGWDILDAEFEEESCIHTYAFSLAILTWD